MTKEVIDDIVTEGKKADDIKVLFNDFAYDITSINAYEYLIGIIDRFAFEDIKNKLYIPSWYIVKMLYGGAIIKDKDNICGIDIYIYIDRLSNNKTNHHKFINTSYIYLERDKEKYYFEVRPCLEP